MEEALQFLIRYGYAVLFVWVLGEQIGLPIPSMPLLLAAGALAGNHQLSFILVIGLAAAASLVSDILWFEFGRLRGGRVLRLLCRVSLEPDSCVRRTENAFARYGVLPLVVAKFVPGLNTAAPPLAGIIGMRRWRFLLFDTLGALLWVGTFVGLGYLFSDQLEHIAASIPRLGKWLGTVVGAGLIMYIGWKYLARRRFLRRLRMSRITPEELKEELDAGEQPIIVDLRHSLEFDADPHRIPGAIPLPIEELEQRHHEIPRDREIVFYCT